MISVENLVKRFGRRTAVDDVSFVAEQGDVLGFLGPNGAGKSTTMRMITGFLAPDSGTAVVGGHDMRNATLKGQKLIGYLPESAPCYEDMTVTEFLHFMAEIRGCRGRERKQRTEAVLEKCFLQDVRKQPIATLSKGYRQRTCLAQSLIHDPPVLIMDEPTDGLDPNQKQIVREMIRAMAADKVIILSTHLLEEVSAICTRAVIISGGRKVADSTPQELMQDGPLDEVFRRLTFTEDAQTESTPEPEPEPESDSESDSESAEEEGAST